jgi:hypothetical protein
LLPEQNDGEVEQCVVEFMEAADTNFDERISFAEFMVAMHREKSQRRGSSLSAAVSFKELARKVFSTVVVYSFIRVVLLFCYLRVFNLITVLSFLQ